MLLRAKVMNALAYRSAVAALSSGFAALLLIGCGDVASRSDTVVADPDISTVSADLPDPSDTTLVTVYKTPTCGCCGEWVEHMREHGFEVRVEEHDNVTPIRRRLQIPDTLASCHSADVAGYSLEGHIPATDIKRLLSEKPDIRGLAVPGMPAGSPGMEVDGVTQPYATIAFDGNEGRVFERHNQTAR